MCLLNDDRYNLKKLTYDERKARLVERLNALNSAADADDDDEDDEWKMKIMKQLELVSSSKDFIAVLLFIILSFFCWSRTFHIFGVFCYLDNDGFAISTSLFGASHNLF